MQWLYIYTSVYFMCELGVYNWIWFQIICIQLCAHYFHIIYKLCLSMHDIDKLWSCMVICLGVYTPENSHGSPQHHPIEIRKIIWTKPPFLGARLIFQGVLETIHIIQQFFCLTASSRYPSRGIPPPGPHALKLGWPETKQSKDVRMCKTRWKTTKLTWFVDGILAYFGHQQR